MSAFATSLTAGMVAVESASSMPELMISSDPGKPAAPNWTPENVERASRSAASMSDRFDSLLRALATQFGFDPPEFPWTNLQRLGVDDLCRSAGALDAPPLLPD